jgi:hypothetical protein
MQVIDRVDCGRGAGAGFGVRDGQGPGPAAAGPANEAVVDR